MQRKASKRVVVHGHVQGVFFRSTVKWHADQHGVSGWVRNNPDGTVEALFEGDPDEVERLVELAQEGPPGADVARVDVSEEKPEGLQGFEVE